MTGASRSFQGVPERAQCTPVPNVFFSELLPRIADPAELKVTFHIFWLLYRKKGFPRFVTLAELAADPLLRQGLACLEGDAEEALGRGVALAVARGTLVELEAKRQQGSEKLLFLNNPSGRRAAALVEAGAVDVGVERATRRPEGSPRPSIFTLYEENIGLLTPLIAEELKEAQELYPEAWIGEAFAEAARLNKRNWRYVARILERWAREGRGDGERGRDSAGPGGRPDREFDLQRVLRGRYGHLIRH